MKLTRDDVLKLARLAKIDLTDNEVDEFAAEFSALLDYVEQLKAVDVSGLEPTTQVTGLQNVMREDEVKPYGYEPQNLLQNVPAVLDGQIKVKRMIA